MWRIGGRHEKVVQRQALMYEEMYLGPNMRAMERKVRRHNLKLMR